MKALAVAATLAASFLLGGCFDSLVGGDCAEGWVREGDHCRIPGSGDVDAGSGTDTDAGTGTGTGDTDAGPGGEGGEIAGHVVLLGHDYRVHHAAAARVLGNAAAMAGGPDIRIASIVDTSGDPAIVAVRRALDTGLAATGRTWSATSIASVVDGDGEGVDVVLVLPRTASADDSFATGESWRASLTAFVESGCIVIGLDGPATTTADFLRGAGLLDVSANATATGTQVDITTPTDALAIGVPTPYAAERGSVTFTAPAGATIVATSGGAPIALHATR